MRFSYLKGRAGSLSLTFRASGGPLYLCYLYGNAMDRRQAGLSICMTLGWVAAVLTVIWAFYPD